ncbi:MAG: hypothetical protein QXM79_07110, partial [Zestosphaera sp.]
NELETHREQVVRNWIKSSVKDFKEVHSWTWEECYEKLQTIYQRQPAEVRGKVRVFKVERKRSQRS